VLKVRYALCFIYIPFFIFTCIIPRGAPFAGGAPLLGGDGPPCGGPGGAPATGGGPPGGAALFSGAGGPAPLKGLSHEIDFKAQKETTMYGTDKQCCGSMTFWCGSGSADPCL
jgi:hypothetical protein